MAATSTRSNPCSRAIESASGSGFTPYWVPSPPMSRTWRARMRSLMRVSSAARVASPLVVGADAKRRRARGSPPPGPRVLRGSEPDPGSERGHNACGSTCDPAGWGPAGPASNQFPGGYQREQHLDPFRRVSARRRARRARRRRSPTRRTRPRPTSAAGDHPGRARGAAAGCTSSSARHPAIDVVANHVVQLFQLALVYLGAGAGARRRRRGPAADLVQASIVIDTMAAIVDGLGPRLVEHEQTLRDALTQLQLLWVEIADESNRLERGSDLRALPSGRGRARPRSAPACPASIVAGAVGDRGAVEREVLARRRRRRHRCPRCSSNDSTRPVRAG